MPKNHGGRKASLPRFQNLPSPTREARATARDYAQLRKDGGANLTLDDARRFALDGPGAVLADDDRAECLRDVVDAAPYWLTERALKRIVFAWGRRCEPAYTVAELAAEFAARRERDTDQAVIAEAACDYFEDSPADTARLAAFHADRTVRLIGAGEPTEAAWHAAQGARCSAAARSQATPPGSPPGAPHGRPGGGVGSPPATDPPGPAIVPPSALMPGSIFTLDGTNRGNAYQYEINNDRFCRIPQGEDPTPTAICNFVARITEEIVRDNGVEQSAVLVIDGRMERRGRQLPPIQVPAAKFEEMKWVSQWGSEAVILAGRSMRDHVRAAIQFFSTTPTRRVVYSHTGWRKIGDRWAYLHGGGAIGADCAIDGVCVELPEPLANFELPTPPSGADLVAAVRASLRVADLGPDHVTLPALAAVYRAVIDDCDFSVHLVGRTGVFKSELAALAQQHFGASMDARHFPANWSSTANANEELAFHAMHALLVVDDFNPHGALADVQRFHRDADRLLRGVGNHAGRGRARPEGGVRPPKPPRALILSTGEDTPRGHSLRSRQVITEVAEDDIDAGKLTACQADAAAGKYAEAMAGFVRWLAGRRDEVVQKLHAEVIRLRDAALAQGGHRRTPVNFGNLLAGWRVFLDFARDIGAATDGEAVAMCRRAEDAFRLLADRQASHQADADPVEKFLRLLSAAVASGTAHIASKSGSAPRRPDRFGWRYVSVGTGSFQRDDWQPLGVCIGWIDGCNLFLEPEAVFVVAERLAAGQGGGLAITPQTLWRRLNERGFLIAKDEKRETLKVRRTIQGRRVEVLHLRAGVLGIGADADEQDADEPESEDGTEAMSPLLYKVAPPSRPA